jgi:hypothetical protein
MPNTQLSNRSMPAWLMNVEHRLALVEVTARAEGTQAELGAAVRGKLRKQVRDMQTESANKKVHIAQMEKQHERDREDLQGLNIALDSK